MKRIFIAIKVEPESTLLNIFSALHERTAKDLTLGRIKHLNDKDSFKIFMQQSQNTEIQKIPVTEVVLFESILLPTGPVYKPIIKVQL